MYKKIGELFYKSAEKNAAKIETWTTQDQERLDAASKRAALGVKTNKLGHDFGLAATVVSGIATMATGGAAFPLFVASFGAWGAVEFGGGFVALHGGANADALTQRKKTLSP